MWAEFDELAEHTPGNLLWNIPTVEGLHLAHCREVLDITMDIRFVRWDWMCVPQVKRGKIVLSDYCGRGLTGEIEPLNMHAMVSHL